MRQRLAEPAGGRLEGLCEGVSGATGSIRAGTGCEGIERVLARFRGRPFAPHRHDTYAIGITLEGVQTFRYRSEQHVCLPGQCHVLHPDELHDGAAANDEAFAYAILYIDPALIHRAVDGKPLPFVPDPVLNLITQQRRELSQAFDLDSEIDEVARTDIATAVADVLLAASAGRPAPPIKLHCQGLRRVREIIGANPRKRHSVTELERVAGLDRWSLARQFRAAFGTSPSRYRLMRQLDLVRAAIRRDRNLADAALAGGFADQSHMTRQFKRTYGLTPAKWAVAVA